MYTVTTTQLNTNSVIISNSMEFERAADLFVDQCEIFLFITPMCVKPGNYKEENDKWAVVLEEVE